MTEPTQPNIIQLPSSPSPSPRALPPFVTFIILGTLMIAVLTGFIIYTNFYASPVPEPSPVISRVISPTPAVSDISKNNSSNVAGNIQITDQHIKPLYQVDDGIDEDQIHTRHEQALADMQAKIATLSATINAMQNDVQNHKATINQSQQAIQSVLATTVAFFQLRETAESNNRFVSEYQTMQRAAHGMPAAFQGEVDQLQNYANQNTPSLPDLHANLIILEPSAVHAIEKATAQTWWERLEVELSALITVRRMGVSTTPAVFQTMEDAFTQNNLSAALVAFQDLPAPAQAVLGEWLSQAEARNKLDAILHTITEQLVEISLILTPSQSNMP